MSDFSLWDKIQLESMRWSHTQEQIKQKEKIIKLFKEKTKWKNRRAESWYRTPNSSFNGISPECMVKVGQHEAVIKFINRVDNWVRKRPVSD